MDRGYGKESMKRVLGGDEPQDFRRARTRVDIRRVFVACLIGLAVWAVSRKGEAQSAYEYELPPIEYSTSTASNQLTCLMRKWGEDGHPMPPGSSKEFLSAFLQRMSVPTASQVLVFSKTSLQRDLIRPDQPRALYFSDDCYIGWVPGGLVEVVVSDPKLGVVFYSLDSRKPDGPPEVKRDQGCLSCHGGSMTRDWPGLVVRSVYPDVQGNPITAAGGFLTGHDSRMEDRWGGWYVTGAHGGSRHMGNQIAQGRGGDARLDREAGANLTNLDGFFSADRYLRGDSDIVSLMVLEHQVGMHNRLSIGALRVRKWTHYQRQLRRELGEAPTDEPTGSALRVVQNEARKIVEHVFYSGEIPLPEGGIRGAGAFESEFRGNRREDARSRSLKDFALRTRLFTYRCSYMVYSRAFEDMPVSLKTEVFRRMLEVLDFEDRSKEFAHLGEEERSAIREILMATHPEFAAAAESSK